jgi:hypothetical protein
MAIIQTIDFNGLEVPGAYCRIHGIQGSKQHISFQLHCYKDQASYQAGKGFLREIHYAFVPSVSDGSANFIKQAYEYLKTLPEFTGALDC